MVHDLFTYSISQLLLHRRGHHDNTDDGDQQEVEGIHDSGPCGLFNLRAAVTAARAGRRSTAASQLHTENNEEKREMGKTLPSLSRISRPLQTI